jgi:2-methylisocitrate lyase-like PEP mutase family enzyme
MTPSPRQTPSFRELHKPGEPFVLANVWDSGSAKLFAALGAQALATTSAGHAFTLGVKDMGAISRVESLKHAHELVGATHLPLSADLENGYGHSPIDVATTIRMAGNAGVAGCCIEDTALPNKMPYDFDFAVERISAAVDAVRKLDEDFVLTARADGVMTGQYDTDEAIRRIQAFEAAGADVLYVPLPPSMEDLARICKSVKAPVNALAAGQFAQYTVADYANIGIARISLGSAMARVTHATIVNSAKEIFAKGDFSSFLNGISSAEVEDLFDSIE